MSREIVQVQSTSTSLGQILYGLENQMLLSSVVKYFFYPEEVMQVQI